MPADARRAARAERDSAALDRIAAGLAAGGRVLGLDPGSIVCGFAVLALDAKGRPALVECGTLEAKKGQSLAGRLALIAGHLDRLCAEHRPCGAAIEGQFAGKNSQSALVIGASRGVALAAVGGHCPDAVVELAPSSMKLAIAGTGAASKEQVARALALRGCWPVKGEQPPLDASDAVGLAWCLVDRALSPTRKALLDFDAAP